MGVCGLIFVSLMVFEVKKFENHCYKTHTRVMRQCECALQHWRLSLIVLNRIGANGRSIITEIISVTRPLSHTEETIILSTDNQMWH